MKDLETIHRINGTSEAEAARAAVPFTYANGLNKPPVQVDDLKKAWEEFNDQESLDACRAEEHGTDRLRENGRKLGTSALDRAAIHLKEALTLGEIRVIRELLARHPFDLPGEYAIAREALKKFKAAL